MRYRRVYIKGGCYFFTVVTEKRRLFSLMPITWNDYARRLKR